MNCELPFCECRIDHTCPECGELTRDWDHNDETWVGLPCYCERHRWSDEELAFTYDEPVEGWIDGAGPVWIVITILACCVGVWTYALIRYALIG